MNEIKALTFNEILSDGISCDKDIYYKSFDVESMFEKLRREERVFWTSHFNRAVFNSNQMTQVWKFAFCMVVFLNIVGLLCMLHFNN